MKYGALIPVAGVVTSFVTRGLKRKRVTIVVYQRYMQHPFNVKKTLFQVAVGDDGYINILDQLMVQPGDMIELYDGEEQTEQRIVKIKRNEIQYAFKPGKPNIHPSLR